MHTASVHNHMLMLIHAACHFFDNGNDCSGRAGNNQRPGKQCDGNDLKHGQQHDIHHLVGEHRIDYVRNHHCSGIWKE